MNLRHMRVFISVYQEMNITKAAVILHMTQPAVSRSIQELESYYGIKFFERINNRLYRTQNSTNFYQTALHIVESFDNLEKDIKNWDELGILRIGGTMTIGNVFLPLVVSSFQKKYPKLKIKVTVSKTSDIQKAILENKLDLAIIEGTVSNNNIISDFLMNDRLCLILPLDHELCKCKTIYLEDLIKYPMLLRDSGSTVRTFLEHIFAIHNMELEPFWESQSTTALINAVANGLGISILPYQLVKDSIESKKIFIANVSDEKFIHKNFIIWHEQKVLSKISNDFIEFCHNYSLLKS